MGGSSLGAGVGGSGGASAGAAGQTGGSNVLGAGGGGGGAHGFVGAGLTGAPATGGAGGAGGNTDPASAYGAGGGGAGGWGAVVTGDGDLGALMFSVTGGTGGNGGDGDLYQSNHGAQGGSGGNGLVLTGTTPTITISADVHGGNGGNGGVTYGTATVGGNGGAGGTGLFATYASVSISAGVTIAGGNGGQAGAGVSSGIDGVAGVGGIGIRGSGLSIINSGTISGGLENGGAGSRAEAITFVGTDASVLEIRGGSTINGNVLANSIDTLRLGGSSNSSFDVSQIGNAAQYRGFGQMEKTGTSTWELTGIATDTAPWTVKAGTLLVSGSIASSPVTVESTATLAGTGTVGSTTIKDGGFIAPGAGGIGTLSVNGTLALNSGSTYLAEVGAFDVNDRIAVTGAATIDQGAVLDVEATAGYEIGTRYTLLTSSNLVGSFGTVTGDVGALSAFVTANVVHDYDADSVYIDVLQDRAFTAAAITRNQFATAWGVDSLPVGNDLFDAIAWLPTDAAARNAFDLISGEIHASGKTVLIEDTQFLRNAVYGRLVSAGSGAAPAGMSVAPLGYAPPVKAAAPFPVKAEPVAPPPPASAVWAQAFGAWGSIDGNGNAADLDRDAGGFFIGADTLVAGTWRLGVLGGYSRSSFDVDAGASSGEADNYHAGLYAGAQWGALALRTGAAYTWSDVETSRIVAFPGYADYLTASYDASTAQAFGEFSYRVGNAVGVLEPFAGLAYVSLDTDGFTEDGGDAALTTTSATTDVTYTTLGLRASTDFTLGAALATVRGMAGWQHAFGDTTPLSTFAFEGGLPFTVAGLPIAEDVLVLEAGLDVALFDAVRLGITYSGQFGEGSQMWGGRGVLSWNF